MTNKDLKQGGGSEDVAMADKDQHVVVRAYVKSLHGHMKTVTSVQYNHEGDLLLSSSKDTNCSACIWHPNTGDMLGSLTTVGSGDASDKGYDLANAAICINRYSTMAATASNGEEVMLWSVQTGKLLGKISRSLSSTSAVQFSYGDHMLMSASKGRGGQPSAISIYNMPFAPRSTGEDIEPVKTAFNPTVCHVLENKDDKVNWASWGPTNDTVYFSVRNEMRILDVETNKVVVSKEVHDGEDNGEKGTINRFKFASDYLTLCTASNDKTAKLIDFRDLNVIQVYQSDVPVNDVSISPIADHVIVGGGMDAQDVTTQGGNSTFDIKVFHRVHGNQLGQVARPHFGTITALSFAPDGRGFASASVDGFVKVYHFDERYDSAPGRIPVWSLKDASDN